MLGVNLPPFSGHTEKLIQAWRSLDAEGIVSSVSPGIVAYYPGAPFPDAAPMERNDAESVEAMKMILENIEFFNMTPYNPQYRVFGNTGMAWGHLTWSLKQKGEPAETLFLRYTLTWTKSDGKWLLVMTHYSPIPLGD